MHQFIRPTVLGVVIAFIASMTGQAQSFDYPDFSDTTGIVAVGDATPVGAEFVLAGAPGEVGGIWSATPMSVVAGFDATFDVSINVGFLSGEGLAFVVQGSPAGSSALGNGAIDLGYEILNSLAIELDLQPNTALGDTSFMEVSVHTGGAGLNSAHEMASIGRTTVPFLLQGDHAVRVRYLPGFLDIYIDDLANPVLSIAYDIQHGGTLLAGGFVGGLSLPDETAFVGMTAAATGLAASFAIESFEFTSDPVRDPCFAGSVLDVAGEPVDLLTVNGSAGGFFRRVPTFSFDPLTITVSQPPMNSAPAGHLVMGTFGLPDGSEATPTPVGAICFPVVVGPIQPPGIFTLSNTFGPIPAPLVVASPTPWTYFRPTGAPFPVDVTLQGVVVRSNAPFSFAITNAVTIAVATGPAPTITSVNPTAALPGETIAVVGTGFRAGLSVLVDGIAVTPTTMTSTEVAFAYPENVSCGATVEIRNVDGQAATAELNPNPIVTGMSMNSGPVSGGTTVVITGTGFGPQAQVAVDGVVTTSTLAMPSVIVVSMPAAPSGQPGPVDVAITTVGGCLTTTMFTYQ